MPFVFYDSETTGTDPTFDQILQFAAIRTDDDLNPLDTFSIRGRLLPHVVPSPGALLVTGVRISDIVSCPLSHFEMMRQIRAKLSEWSVGGAVFAGWNSLGFDEHFLRQAYYQTLQPIYQTQTNGNGRADIMRIVQAAAAVVPNAITIPLQDDGKPTFRLGLVAQANGMQLENAHEALADTGATLAMAQLVRQRLPSLWHTLIGSAHKASAQRLIEENEVLLLSETYGRQAFNFAVCAAARNPENSSEWGLFDLQFDPAKYLDVSDESLTDAIVGKTKVIRRIRTNSQPNILPIGFAPDDIRGGLQSLSTYQARTQAIREHPTFGPRLGRILAGLYADRAKSEYVEQKIYDGFPSRLDEARMTAFHRADWLERLVLIHEIEDPRYRQLGQRVLAAERLDLLSFGQRARFHVWRRERLMAVGDVPWLTVSRARQEIDSLWDTASTGQRLQLDDMRQYLDFTEAALAKDAA